MSNTVSEVEILKLMLKMKDQTLAGVIEKMEEAVHEAAFYKERDAKLHERIDALEAELHRRDQWAALWKRCAKKLGEHDRVMEIFSELMEVTKRALVAESELAALKKDARLLAEEGSPRYESTESEWYDAKARILAATKESDNVDGE